MLLKKHTDLLDYGLMAVQYILMMEVSFLVEQYPSILIQ